ncbi:MULTISPECIES: 2OG-Fe(II) oxygenase [unclassified Saccharibacter]|uniref:2OG-Fe(II) oxygenase family protein n=1 Tax=unclassified Saccharibacter TaxID=2648722 RepID=UPI0013269F05|nr:MULTISPECIES: 2OG-Fe(II) oxygenase [unclassified Saccharibacter]MXV37005.1 2OG-Fe(II) oxygenase [Saccharibacter sp. EH611]MXV58505.1 2OG-Fe(II) oxygenase [Saccharibacter sp. EH70]MXV66011.1 2OG-Fe(II) oxygenase [Saccharibacter sp. EH60]
MTMGLSLNYEAVRRAEVATHPCPHLVVTDFLSAETLQKVVSLLPELKSGGSYPPSVLSLPPALAGLLEEFQGSWLKEIVSEKFNIDVRTAPSMMTMRGRTREKDGRIHRDSSAKRVTILLYLNDGERDWSAHDGCLRFLNGPDDIEDYAVEIPPAGGTLVIFPNGPDTWHGHRTYVGPRFTVQLNYMAGDGKAQHEIRRHGLSALWKRLVRSA